LWGKPLLFVAGSIILAWISRSSLSSGRNHGFYRFLSWESILLLLVLNTDFWFADPFSFRQLCSWFFLIISLVLITTGVLAFHRYGESDPLREDPALVGIEKTTRLVTGGIYRFIRHPFYSSLLFLGWGVLLKQLTPFGIGLAVFNTIMLLLTARIEERENIDYFGDDYLRYMAQVKGFVPWLF